MQISMFSRLFRNCSKSLTIVVMCTMLIVYHGKTICHANYWPIRRVTVSRWSRLFVREDESKLTFNSRQPTTTKAFIPTDSREIHFHRAARSKQ